MATLRKKCVICQESIFTDCFSIINTINIVEDEDKLYNENEIKDLNFIGCVKCGCVQLKNLFNPEEIYSQKSHSTDGTIWNKHNEEFIQFIGNNIFENSNILEIGGGSGKFAKNIMNNIKTNSYKILDIFAPDIDINDDIEYVYGNCEVFDFNNINIDSIILCHVFEHLYEPKKFIENISNTSIREIFISIPDMDNLIKNGDINNLNIQHTFYIDTQYITRLFNEFNYNLNSIYNYEKNSVFYHFVKNEFSNNKKITNEYKNIDLIEKQNIFYYNIKERIKNIKIDKPFLICPSGYYGKIVYHYLDESTKNNIIGFLDSDKYKINKRLSGTNSMIFSKAYIKNYENAIVLIIAEKYKDEIIDELLSYNNLVKFLFI